MTFNIFNSLILAGIVQGFIFGGVVGFSRKYNAPATRILALLIVAFSLNNLQYFLVDINAVDFRVLYGTFWIPAHPVMGPLLYAYGYRFLNPDLPLSRRQLFWLSAPFAISVIVSTFLKIFYADEIPSAIPAPYIAFVVAIEFVGVFLAIYYVSVLLRIAYKAKGQNRSFKPEVVRPQMRWFRGTLWGFAVVILIWLTISVKVYVLDAPYTWWYFTWIPLSFLTYWLGHIGIYKYGIQEERKKIRDYNLNHSYNVVESNRSAHLEAFHDLLVNRKYFLDPQLTLDSVATELGVSKSYLSRTFNQEYPTGFSEYINRLRVDEACLYLRNQEFKNYTLVAIGLEAGFSSKATFNSAFRRITGMTPSEYRKNVQGASAVSV